MFTHKYMYCLRVLICWFHNIIIWQHIAHANNVNFVFKVCDFPLDIDNGTYTQTQGNTYGSVTTYACNSGWYLNGTATVTCWDDSVWVGDIPNCFGSYELIVLSFVFPAFHFHVFIFFKFANHFKYNINSYVQTHVLKHSIVNNI